MPGTELKSNHAESLRLYRLLILTLLLPSAQLFADQITIPAGPFIMGSDRAERELGYQLDEARGSHFARQYRWFENETRRTPTLPTYRIDRTPVTQSQYQKFIMATNHPQPGVDAKTWASYRLIYPYRTALRYSWQHGQPPAGRQLHPVVLVTAADAETYCAWRGSIEGKQLQLPSEAEWEKAARGALGRIFPWGDQFDPKRLNSEDDGPGGTEPVANRPGGISPYGVADMAGQVFEWTRTLCPGDQSKRIVKGGSWDDYPGVTRAAAHHCRPAILKHVLIGFRCVEALSRPSMNQ
ncbi:MAG TPA: hypothetical protein ENI62_05120 [Gammaproteobacteria bacterium]|nr:hypothetical protein [Gammaproteobacteria bacterium]